MKILDKPQEGYWEIEDDKCFTVICKTEQYGDDIIENMLERAKELLNDNNVQYIGNDIDEPMTLIRYANPKHARYIEY